MMCYQMKSPTDTDQLNLRPTVGLIKNLETLAMRFRGDVKKKNEVAVDILEHYMSHWARAEQVKKDLVKKQLEAIGKDAGIHPEELPYEEIKDQRGALDDELENKPIKKRK